MGHAELTDKGIGERVFETDNTYKASRSDKTGGICAALVARWIRRAMEGLKGVLSDPAVLGQILKAIAEQEKLMNSRPENDIEKLRGFRLIAEDQENPYKTVTEVLRAIAKSRGFFYYSIQRIDRTISHALAIYIGASGETSHYVLDPNYGLYRYSGLNFDNLCTALEKHLADGFYGTNFKEGTVHHKIYRISSVLPKNPKLDDDPVSLSPVIQIFKPATGSTDHDRYYEGLAAYWVKRCLTQALEHKEIAKFRDADQKAIREIVQESAKNKQAGEPFKKMFQAAGLKLGDPQLSLGFKLGSTMSRGNEVEFGSKTFTPMIGKIQKLKGTDGRIVVISARGTTLAGKVESLGKEQSFLVAIARPEKSSADYLLDPTPRILKLMPFDMDPACRLYMAFRDCRRVDCDVYVL